MYICKVPKSLLASHFKIIVYLNFKIIFMNFKIKFAKILIKVLKIILNFAINSQKIFKLF